MDTIREKIQNPVVIGIGALILGLLIGLLVAWVIWPVKYTDAAPQHLHADFQQDWLSMAIDSFSLNKDTTLAARRFGDLGEYAEDTLSEVEMRAMPNQVEAINSFRSAVNAVSEIPLPEEGVVEAEPTETAEEGKTSPLLTVLFIMCGLTIVLGIALAAFFYLRNRSSQPATVTPAMEAQEAARQAEWTDYSTAGAEPPITQFMASYKVGDDLFDDSFSIDSPNGEFLGECGVGISETIGVGDPKKVTSFEVWLFDKNDIQTVTKVLMSEHAFQDSATLDRLSAKGEPVLAEIGSQAILETATLKMSARIVDMNYGEGSLPENSFFDSLILEIAVWQKQA